MARVSKYQTEITAAQNLNYCRAGLYIRLSREDGDRAESESVASQRAILQRFVSERAEISLVDYYVDDGWSGTDFNRPEFQRMLNDLKSEKINCVIVKDLSRFGRNYVEAGKYLEIVFPILKVRFIAVNDNIDSFDNPSSMNSVLVPFKNILNDEYCRDISQKVRSALDIRRRQGKFIGSFASYGYKKDPADHNKLIIDDEAAATVREIYEKFLSGYSIIGITRELNGRGVLNPSAYKKSKGLSCIRAVGQRESELWCDSTVRRILKNQLYTGDLVQKKNQVISYKIHAAKSLSRSEWIVVKNTHEAIISRADFDKACALLKRDTRISPKSGKLSPFSGLIKCADCGRAMQKRTVVQPNKTYEYYVCSTYKKMHSAKCTKHAVRVDFLEKITLEFLNRYISMAVDFNRLSQKISAEKLTCGKLRQLKNLLTEKQKEIEDARKILTDIYPDFKSGLLDREQYLNLKEKYARKQEKAENAADELKREIEAYENGECGAENFVQTFIKYKGLKSLTRDVTVELIENIYIHESGEIEIHLKCKDEIAVAKEYFNGSALS